MMFLIVGITLLATASATLRGGILAPQAAKITCAASSAKGQSCVDDLGCFAKRTTYSFDMTSDSSGYVGVTVKNCIPRSSTSAISFISVSDCSSSCTKTDSVLLDREIYKVSKFYAPDQYCRELCIYAHDGQYKLNLPNNVTTQGGCISSDTQRCNLCYAKVNICRPTPAPTFTPTAQPSAVPTVVPTAQPSAIPTAVPSCVPSAIPTAVPTFTPSAIPTATPTFSPSATPTAVPSAEPTYVPTAIPTAEPTYTPSAVPTAQPTFTPTAVPTAEPTFVPTAVPTAEPTYIPTATPTAEPTAEPTYTPTAVPPAEPTFTPTAEPTAEPTYAPTVEPTAAPTVEPTFSPTVEPTFAPTIAPTVSPTVVPTLRTPAPTLTTNAAPSCASPCAADACCCTVGSNTQCYNKVDYGGDTLTCAMICGNAECEYQGKLQNFLTCNCLKNCQGSQCNALGGGGNGYVGTSICCRASRVDYTVATTTQAYGSVCQNCDASIAHGWVSAATCAEILYDQSLPGGTTTGNGGGNGGSNAGGNGNGNGKGSGK